MQSIDWVETYASRASEDVSDKEEIDCNNTIEQYKKWLTLMML